MPDKADLAREAFDRAQAEVAAGNADTGQRWLDRACRLAPQDQTLKLALATACLGQDDRRAAELFASVSAASDVREAWLGLATARRRLGDAPGAAAALVAALARHVPDRRLVALADAIANAAGAPGWCGLSGDGRVTIRPGAIAKRAEVELDGRPVARAGARLTRWLSARGLSVTTADGTHLLGSPIDVHAIARTVGCVACRDGGLEGWAWHPGDSDTDPVITIRPVVGRGQIRLTAVDTGGRIDAHGLLARPRRFHLPASKLACMGAVHVLGRDGGDLLGSPLDPGAEQRSAMAAAAALTRLYSPHRAGRRSAPLVAPAAIPADTVGRQPVGRAPPRRNAVDIIVPVHGGGAQVLTCLDSVLATAPEGRLVVVDDASREPDLVRSLDELARRKRIRLIRNTRNLGFAASANAGLVAARGRDVVLLNSDTLVAPGWLDGLREAAYSARDIGTATPLSNDATILNYPNQAGRNPVPDLAETRRLAALAARANRGVVVDIPVAVGFCMFIRRDCLAAVGLLRADVFAQGYGEENDFCLRARHLGWRHVAVPGVFAGHVGGHSFGAAARHLRMRNEALLERLHPGYARLIEAHDAADPLAPARRRLDLARWRAARAGHAEAVILITHDGGGGVERQIAASVARHRAAGRRAIVLRPARSPDGRKGVVVADGATDDFPNLRYVLPGELAVLRRLLAAERPCGVELHHMVGHDPAIVDLIAGLGVPFDVHVHDYAWLCGRIALVGRGERYCGEPEVRQCEACIADAGSLLEEDIGVGALRARSATLLASARRVLTPSEDTAARIRRYFPSARPRVVPHEDDTAIADPPAQVAIAGRCRVCLVGAIGIHKGYQVLLDCARDAAERQLPLEFVVVGHTIDDSRLLATGRVFVTGEFAAEEAVELIKAQRATLAWLPSIFPETWCFTLAEAWRAGLKVAAFDIGAPAERIRRSGRGLLLPLGLPPAAVNIALVAAAGL